FPASAASSAAITAAAGPAVSPVSASAPAITTAAALSATATHVAARSAVTASGLYPYVGREVALAEDFAFAYPHFDTDDPVNRLGFDDGIVDIGAERVQRRTTVLVLFPAGDLGAVEPASDPHLDPFRARAHG